MSRTLIALFCLFLVVGSQATSAQETHVPKLGIAPVGVSGPYFDITMEPGEQQELHVQLGNFGTETVRAQTYAADVYSILNGGFGAKLADAPISGVTKWLSYQSEIVDLDAGTQVERAFTVSVPSKTKPGEYITSVVIQNADPIKGTQGSISIDQVTRQIIAVVIRVPGPEKPALKIMGATYELLPSYARVLVHVDNTGNVLLKPGGEIVIRDNAGAELARSQIAMDSVYAGTDTSIEIILLKPLEPGDYTVSASLKDDQHDLSVKKSALPLTVQDIETTGSPTPEIPTIVIDSIAINELRDPSTDTLQGVEFVVDIDNPALPVANAQLTLHVSRDGQKVEDLVLGSSLSFPGGKAQFSQRYLPMTGWTAGTWSFSVTIEVVDPDTGTVTVLATADAPNVVVVP